MSVDDELDVFESHVWASPIGRVILLGKLTFWCAGWFKRMVGGKMGFTDECCRDSGALKCASHPAFTKCGIKIDPVVVNSMSIGQQASKNRCSRGLADVVRRDAVREPRALGS